MDLNQVIQELLKERNRLDALIKALEMGLDPVPVKGRRSSRGRKTMSSDERLQVAERMRRYWAGRKAAAVPPAGLNEIPTV
jgi:hypothetical protein